MWSETSHNSYYRPLRSRAQSKSVLQCALHLPALQVSWFITIRVGFDIHLFRPPNRPLDQPLTNCLRSGPLGPPHCKNLGVHQAKLVDLHVQMLNDPIEATSASLLVVAISALTKSSLPVSKGHTYCWTCRITTEYWDHPTGSPGDHTNPSTVQPVSFMARRNLVRQRSWNRERPRRFFDSCALSERAGRPRSGMSAATRHGPARPSPQAESRRASRS